MKRTRLAQLTSGLRHLAALALLACLPTSLPADDTTATRHTEISLPTGLQGPLEGFYADYEHVKAFNSPKPHYAAIVFHTSKARLYYSSSIQSLDDALKWAMLSCSDSTACVLYETLGPSAASASEK